MILDICKTERLLHTFMKCKFIPATKLLEQTYSKLQKSNKIVPQELKVDIPSFTRVDYF